MLPTPVDINNYPKINHLKSPKQSIGFINSFILGNCSVLGNIAQEINKLTVNNRRNVADQHQNVTWHVSNISVLSKDWLKKKKLSRSFDLWLTETKSSNVKPIMPTFTFSYSTFREPYLISFFFSLYLEMFSNIIECPFHKYFHHWLV